jgi:hypothetical protein
MSAAVGLPTEGARWSRTPASTPIAHRTPRVIKAGLSPSTNSLAVRSLPSAAKIAVAIATPNTAPICRKVLLMPDATAVWSGATERMTAVVTVGNAMAIPAPAITAGPQGCGIHWCR